MDLSYKKKSCMAFGVVALLLFAAAAVVVIRSRKHVFQGHQYLSTRQVETFSKKDTTNRRLLVSTADYDDYDGDDGNGVDGSGTMDRISRGCSKENIYISQGQTSPLPNGIPTYTVLIQNICMSNSISDIHLTCGWFSSARLINPNVFKRISYDDCLVNNGNPISPGQTISFQYANTYPYPLSVSYVSC